MTVELVAIHRTGGLLRDVVAGVAINPVGLAQPG